MPKLLRLTLAVLLTAGVGCRGALASGAHDAGSTRTDAGHATPDAGAHDAGTDADDEDPMPLIVPGSTYLQRLMERRKVADLYPWAELYKGGQLGCLPVGAPANSPVALSIKRPYSMNWGDLGIYSINNRAPGPVLAAELAPGEVLFTEGALGTDQAFRAFSTESIIGDAFRGWWGLGAGQFWPAEEMLRANFNTTQALASAGGAGLQLHIVGRGYREYPLGYVQPAQKTRAEYTAEGYRFQPYQYGASVVIPASTPINTPFQVELTLDRDFLADSLTINQYMNGQPNDSSQIPDLGSFSLVKMSTDRVMFSDYVSRYALVGEPQKRTAWHWPLPVTMPKDMTIYFYAQQPVAIAVDLQLDFVLHGHLLIK